MKRKLNESYAFPVKIDVVQLVHDYPELQGNMDDLATHIEDTNADATVSKEEDGDTVYMVIDGLTQDDIIDIFEDEYNIDDVDTYFTYDDADDELDDVESDDDARAAAEADMEDEYGDDYQDMDEDYGLDDEGEWLDIPEDDDARDTAIDDMKDEYGDDYVDMDESIDDDYLDDENDYDDMIPDYDEVDPNDPDALDARDDAYADMDAEGELDDDDDLYDETYEDADEEFADEDSLNDSDDEFDECMEDEEFECYESKNDRRLKRKKLLEKKKGCCPGKRRNGKRLVNLSEALKMRKNGLTTKDIVKSAKKTTLNESIINRAINKAKSEPVNKNAKLQQKRRELLALKESIGSEKFEFIRKAMKSGKKNLYEKKTINGKNITEYTAKELLELLNTVKAQHTKLMKSYKSLNESASKSTKRELRDSILNKEKLMNILDEELTYRLTYKKLIKAKGLKLNEDEETQDNPLEPLPVDPTGSDDASDDADNADDSSTDKADDSSTDENPDTDEEVELSRVVITVANQAAADELKQSLVDAGVPDDAIEFEDEDDETDDSKDDSESTDDNADDTSTDDENSDDSSDTDDNASNESLHYNKFKKLLEDNNDDSSDDANADDSDDSDSDSDDANADDSTDDNADGDDKPVKVVLTNTDYVNDLADVLNNEYGITKEEFEDMIGGQIVDDDSDSTDDSDSSDDSDSDSDEDKSDDKKDDEPSTNGDDAVDAMSQEELDKLFGGN